MAKAVKAEGAHTLLFKLGFLRSPNPPCEDPYKDWQTGILDPAEMGRHLHYQDVAALVIIMTE